MGTSPDILASDNTVNNKLPFISEPGLSCLLTLPFCGNLTSIQFVISSQGVGGKLFKLSKLWSF